MVAFLPPGQTGFNEMIQANIALNMPSQAAM